VAWRLAILQERDALQQVDEKLPRLGLRDRHMQQRLESLALHMVALLLGLELGIARNPSASQTALQLLATQTLEEQQSATC
jgi:hypothetical protein